ncbi:MAG: MAG1210 family protein [Candidatus Spyradosoma sp.]
MIEDLHEPLARYRDEFREKFARLTREKFAELAKRSRVDVEANRRLAAEIRKLQAEADSAKTRKTGYGCLALVGFLGAAASLAGAFAVHGEPGRAQAWCVSGVVAGLALGLAAIPRFRAAAKTIGALLARVAEKKGVAWAQMEPLNRLYTWDVSVGLIEATVPLLKFDPYFTAERLASLRGRFGWDDSFNDGKSVVFAQSGLVNGNPFVFAHYLEMTWGEKTYEGTKTISWTETERGSDGKTRSVRRYETLRAYVTRPIPVYDERKLLLYGNAAAPNLSFSRSPSGLTGKDAGFWSSVRKRWRLNRLKAYSRDLTDDSDFTLMSNHEFETLFHAKDRDDEVGFRLLFTPAAQTQMLNLMKDSTVGYGDDFTFVKRKKMNVLFSKHLDEATLDTDPSRFRAWDYDAAFSSFVSFNESYFKALYFALAPLLAIPLYRQAPPPADVRQGVPADAAASFWEHEALANHYGEDAFRHPSCITRSLLKTRVVERANGESRVAVTAHGYRGEERVDYEDVYGGDGRLHRVAVHWTEYLPVQRTSAMRLRECGAPSELFGERAAASRGSLFRRSIVSCLEAS